MSHIGLDNANISSSLKGANSSYTGHTVYFLDLRSTKLETCTEKRGGALDSALGEILNEILPHCMPEPALIKTHIGDQGNDTGINPELANSTINTLRDRGVMNIVTGDATVVYTSERGFKQNPPGDPSRYLRLAKKHGWSKESTGVPFIILDRPETSVPNVFEFEESEDTVEVGFTDNLGAIRISGGMRPASTIINHVHLPLHPQTHIAMAIKGLGMGIASSNGKFQLHQNLWPEFRLEDCTLCGSCAEICPQGAISFDEDHGPRLSRQTCVGCGQCLVICREQGNCIVMEGDRVRDWSRGTDIMGRCLVDYLVSMLYGKWENLVNVCHMVNITEDCDCLPGKKIPFVEDIGFLVGKSPVAVDYIAMKLLLDQCDHLGVSGYSSLEMLREGGAGRDMFHYAQEHYGFSLDPKVEIIKF